MSGIPVGAQKGTGFYAPDFSPGKFKFANFVGPAYNRFVQGIAGIDVINMEVLYREYQSFLKNDSRLIILFKHGAKADGPVVLQTVIRELKKWAAGQGRTLPAVTHTHFLYGKDVLNWAGFLARWMFPAIGGIPVINGRMEKQSHSVIRDVLANGRFPVAFAPEGQVTYHTYRVFPFSAGTAKLAAWTHQDLRRAGRDESVVVLPMAISYRYAKNTKKLVSKLMSMLDRKTGLQTAAMESRREALLETTDRLLDSLEAAYASAYPRIVNFSSAVDREKRILRLCDMILRCLESMLGYEPRGDILERVFRVRYWVMDSLHREDIDPDSLTPAERSLADHRAYIAAAANQHQQIVDLLEYVHPGYIGRGCTETRLVEYGLNLLDLCNRMEGGNVDSRFLPKGMEARVLFGEPLDASGFFEGSGLMLRPRLSKFDAAVKSAFEDLVGELETIYG